MIGLWTIIISNDDDDYDDDPCHLLGTHCAPVMVLSSLQGYVITPYH